MDILAGVKPEEIVVKPLRPYCDIVCDFFNDWSRLMRSHPEGRRLGDVVSFAFFCRKGNLERLREEAHIEDLRMGRGLCFHIAPSNIPVNFAFSYAFGLLAGNANIVRVSSKAFSQVDIICDTLNKLFEDDRYEAIRRMTSIVRYDHDSEITDRLSGMCDIRLIWGGDETIAAIRRSILKPGSTEITFADRYSIAVIDGKTVRSASEEELEKLAGEFYNDTYMMDQNACSSPQMIYWIGAEKADKDRFWDAVSQTIEGYDVSEFIASEKYTMLCDDAIVQQGVGRLKKYQNKLYVVDIPANADVDMLDGCHGKYGLFCEQEIDGILEILDSIDRKVQTCTYYGVDARGLAEQVLDQGVTGIDRIVPIGKALDIGVYWDGYDLVRQMSRRIEVV
ncbi:MAG: acyl-CoA reductase [Eubacterium sp.]|nr:acyl-CoA reductase [Eubacterium sp.]